MLKDVMPLDLETEVKPYLRIENSAANAVLNILMAAFYSRADAILNRSFAADAEELHDIKFIMLQTIAFWYENPGDTAELPPAALNGLMNYSFFPGF